MLDSAALYDSETASSTSSLGLSRASQASDSHLVDRLSQSHRRLHPSKPNTLHAGFSGDSGKDVWVRFKQTYTLPSGNSRSDVFFYDYRDQRCSEESLQIQWHQDYQYKKFTTPGGDKDTERRNQRLYLYRDMQNIQRDQRQNSQSHVINRAGSGTSASAAASQEGTCKRKVSPETDTEEPSRLGISNKRRRRSEPKTDYDSDVEIPSGKEHNSYNDNPRGRRETKPAIGSALTPNTMPEGDSSDDVEIISALSTKPSSVRSQYDRLQESEPNVKSEFASDPARTTATNLPSNVINATSLLVSVSNQPDRAPANGKYSMSPFFSSRSPLLHDNPLTSSPLDAQLRASLHNILSSYRKDNANALITVPLSQCLNLPQLYETLVTECDLKGKVASQLSEVSARYTWDQKRHLIRKARPRDWTIFVDTLRKAWERDATRFAEDGCEVEMFVHLGN